MHPVFLQLDEVLGFHTDQINRYGGSPGIRDMGLLQSALAAPSATFGGAYLHGDLFEMAAAYLYHIVNNHPFVDGNKRTGTVTAMVFLKLNQVNLNVEDKTFEAVVLAVAEGKMEKSEIASFLRDHARKS